MSGDIVGLEEAAIAPIGPYQGNLAADHWLNPRNQMPLLRSNKVSDTAMPERAGKINAADHNRGELCPSADMPSPAE